MAGIYIHIPFCSSKCTYCDFYSVPAFEYKADYIKAIKKEVELRAPEFKKAIGAEPVTTIYFGGGTPSALSPRELQDIYIALSEFFDLSQVAEITTEANPDDLTDAYIKELTTLEKLHVNRMSIGTQTFNDQMLKTFRRRHDAESALQAVKRVKEHGITNLSLDLIYAYPDETEDMLHDDIEKLTSLSPTHISAYQLTYEPNTMLTRLVKQGEIKPLAENDCVALYFHLVKHLEQAGFAQYEISNFSLPGYESKHNSSYWNMTPYLGLGPSAHSFYSDDRMHNPTSLTKYIKALLDGINPAEAEGLTKQEMYNDFVITALRTRRGLDTTELKTRFGSTFHDYFIKQTETRVPKRLIENEGNGIVRLTQEGILVSDSVFTELIWV
ncbi:MAG: radical SAM family heme chaperone HemW [Paludibacteraceae bacterium]|nr:radical SAM family heme chaperone HemW [Paludibacteraceae bacterium]